METIKIEKATKIISSFTDKMTVTEENGFRVTVFEPETKDVILDVGKWYNGGLGMWLIIESWENEVKCAGFFGHLNSKWKGNYTISGLHDMEPADMQEVKKLLIKEAEKNYPKGTEFIGVSGQRFISTGKFAFHNLMDSRVYKDDLTGCLFDFETGKWAEIIKPLYTNEYKTEFFGDETPWYVFFENGKFEIKECAHSTSYYITHGDLGEDLHNSEILKDETECLRWITDNYIRIIKQ